MSVQEHIHPLSQSALIAVHHAELLIKTFSCLVDFQVQVGGDLFLRQSRHLKVIEWSRS